MAAAAVTTIKDQKNQDWQNNLMTIHSKLAFLLENEILADVKFIVGDIEKEPIFAHKFILMMGSSEFQRIFSKEKHCVTKLEIKVPDVCPMIFRAILKFTYTGKFEFDMGDVDRVMDLLVASCKYKMVHLTSQCTTVLIGSITEKNAISVYQLAILLNLDVLSYYAFKYICRKADEVFSGSDLCTLSKENLKRLARSDALNIDEMDLFKAAVKWAKATCQFRKVEANTVNLRDVLKEVIPLIRFLLMTAEEISLHVVTLNILTDEELVQIYRYCTITPPQRSTSSITQGFFIPRPRNRFWIAERFSSVVNRTCWKNKARGWLCKPKWQCISFKVDQAVSIIGVGLYGEASVTVGEYFGTCKPYSYELRIYNEISQMLSSKVDTTQNPGKLVFAEFDNPFCIQPSKWYTLAARIKSSTGSFVGEGGRSHIKIPCGNTIVNFHLKTTVNLRINEPEEDVDKEGETNVRNGEIPEIAFFVNGTKK